MKPDTPRCPTCTGPVAHVHVRVKTEVEVWKRAYYVERHGQWMVHLQLDQPVTGRIPAYQYRQGPHVTAVRCPHCSEDLYSDGTGYKKEPERTSDYIRLYVWVQTMVQRALDRLGG